MATPLAGTAPAASQPTPPTPKSPDGVDAAAVVGPVAVATPVAAEEALADGRRSRAKRARRGEPPSSQLPAFQLAAAATAIGDAIGDATLVAGASVHMAAAAAAAATAAEAATEMAAVGAPRRGRRRKVVDAVAATAAAAAAGAVPLPPAAAGPVAPLAEAAVDAAVQHAAVLRCVTDLEAAVAHVRSRDPLLAPLIEAHGLPHSLIATRFAGGGGAAPAAADRDAPPALPAVHDTAAVGTVASAAATTGAASTVADGAVANAAIAAATAAAAANSDDGDGGGSAWGAGCSVFAALARSVVYQQLATGAAASIWGRVLTVCQARSTSDLTPAHVLGAPPEQLRGAGLSGRKVEYLTGLAEVFRARSGLDEALTAATDLPLLVSELTAIRGIGAWTVHMLAMFHLGLADVLPTGDLGVRRGLQLMHGLSELPSPGQVEALTESWRPYRSVGSWYMWRIPPPPRNGGAAARKKAAAAKGGKQAKSKAAMEAEEAGGAAAGAGDSGTADAASGADTVGAGEEGDGGTRKGSGTGSKRARGKAGKA